MGTFAGHALPGSFFLLFGVWSVIFQLKKFYKRKRYELGFSNPPVPIYKNQNSTPCQCYDVDRCCCRGKRVPVDSFLKSFCCLVGLIGEIYTGFSNGQFKYIGNAQHSTMFSMFMLSGFAEILEFYQIISLPMYTNYFFSFLALVTEGVLFAFHLHGRTPADVYVHTLLIYAVLILIGVGLYEAINLRSILAGLLRSMLLALQGTWFWHVGAILYPPVSWLPTWDEMAMESIPRATNILVYHILLIFGFICLVAMVMGAPLRNSPKVLGNQHKGDTRSLLEDDKNVDERSEDEMEVMEMRPWKGRESVY